MATIETFKVNKGLKYLIKARKQGYYDYAQLFEGTEEDTSVSVPAMTVYDGLSMVQTTGVESADTVDFTNTTLPWKWDYEKYLSTSKFALMPVGNYEYYNYVPAINKDITVVGSPTISPDFVVSNFSSSNYLTTTKPTVDGFNAGASTWYFKFKTGSSLQYGQVFEGLIGLYVDGSTLMSWNTLTSSAVVLFTLSTNTEYWVKVKISGSVRIFYYSTNGETYTQCYVDSFKEATGSTVDIAAIGYVSYANYFNGTVDLKGLKVEDNNGNTVFSGTTMVKDTTNNITFVGSPTFNAETMVVSNFSTSNYITTPVFNPGNSPWEVRIKFTTGDSFSNYPQIFMSNKANSQFSIGLSINKSTYKFNFYTTYNNTAWDIDSFSNVVAQYNTTYWTRFGWTGSEYYFEYSLDGKDYVRDISIVSTTPTYNGITQTTIGLFKHSAIASPWTGTIDLSETELLINGETFYKPKVTYLTNTIQGCTYNYTDDGQATTLNCFTVNGDESVILTPDTSYNNERFLGTVNIAEHDVYDYVDGEWRKK